MEPRSIEALLIRAMKTAAEAARVAWPVVLRADAAAKDSREWQNLMRLVSRAIDSVEAEVRSADKPLLLVHPGLLARYDLLALLARLRDRVGRPDGIPGLWLLISSDGQWQMPVIDGKPVPVITPGEWAEIPEAWLENLHRAARRSGEAERIEG